MLLRGWPQSLFQPPAPSMGSSSLNCNVSPKVSTKFHPLSCFQNLSQKESLFLPQEIFDLAEKFNWQNGGTYVYRFFLSAMSLCAPKHSFKNGVGFFGRLPGCLKNSFPTISCFPCKKEYAAMKDANYAMHNILNLKRK